MKSDARVIRVAVDMEKILYPEKFKELLDCAPVVNKKYW